MIDLSDEAYSARSEESAPITAFDLSVGRGFALFVGALVPPMPESNAVALIQKKFRTFELAQERKALIQAEAAASIITGRASLYLARKALIGAQIEMDQRKRESAVVRIQARQRMRQQRRTIPTLRALIHAAKCNAAAVSAYEDHSFYEGEFVRMRGAGGASSEPAQRAITTSKRVGGGFCGPSIASARHRT